MDSVHAIRLHDYTRMEGKTYTAVVGAYYSVAIFQDSTAEAKVPIVGHTFFLPYLVNTLMHAPYQLIASGIKQFILLTGNAKPKHATTFIELISNKPKQNSK